MAATELGPYKLIVGTVTHVKIPMDAVQVHIKNDSQFDLLVSFNPTQPTNITDSLDGTWNATVLRHTDPVIPVQTLGASALEKQLNALGGSYQGDVWISPLNAINIASGGSSSGLQRVWLTTRGPYDPPIVPSANTRQVDLTSQPRIVSVPVGIQNFVAGAWNAGSGDFIFSKLPIPAMMQTDHILCSYLYSAVVQPDATSTSGLMTFSIDAQPLTVGNAPTGIATHLAWGAIAIDSTAHTMTSWSYTPAAPSAKFYNGALPANATQIGFQLTYQTGATLNAGYTIQVDIDGTNLATNGDIGNWAQYVNSSVYTGTGTAPLF
jgi:hypothetical protein